jgi:hypothetical protein
VLPLNDFERAIEKINTEDCCDQGNGNRFKIPDRKHAEKEITSQILIWLLRGGHTLLN